MSAYVIRVLSYKDISNIFCNNGEHKLTGNPRLTHPVVRCTSGKELFGNIWGGRAPSKKPPEPWRVIRGTFCLSPSKGAYQISFPAVGVCCKQHEASY